MERTLSYPRLQGVLVFTESGGNWRFVPLTLGRIPGLPFDALRRGVRVHAGGYRRHLCDGHYSGRRSPRRFCNHWRLFNTSIVVHRNQPGDCALLICSSAGSRNPYASSVSAMAAVVVAGVCGNAAAVHRMERRILQSQSLRINPDIRDVVLRGLRGCPTIHVAPGARRGKHSVAFCLGEWCDLFLPSLRDDQRDQHHRHGLVLARAGVDLFAIKPHAPQDCRWRCRAQFEDDTSGPGNRIDYGCDSYSA